MVQNKLVKLLLLSVVALITYYLVDKFFPEKRNFTNNSEGDDVRDNSDTIFTELIKRSLNDRALKISLVTAFASAGVLYFKDEMIEFLISAEFRSACYKDGKLIDDPICKIISDYDLNVYTESINNLILDNNLNLDSKVQLLSVKLYWLINGDYASKKKYLVVGFLGIIIAASIS